MDNLKKKELKYALLSVQTTTLPEYTFSYTHKARVQKGYSEILGGMEVLAVDNLVYRDTQQKPNGTTHKMECHLKLNHGKIKVGVV